MADLSENIWDTGALDAQMRAQLTRREIALDFMLLLVEMSRYLTPQSTAERAVAYADALLAALEQPKQETPSRG